ncbi:MAG: phosphoesterase, PA-phosphatase related [Bryobacterales bacterium]|nr:phosphoesterase, PA-phosphatase related [Bryobacterales bacterium]
MGYRLAVTVCAFGLCSFPAHSQQADDPPPAQTPQATSTQEPEDARDRVFYSTETEHIKPLATKFVRNVFMDQKDIWTSPLRIHSVEDAIPWIAVGGATAALIASDHWTSRQLPNTVDQVSISKDVSQLGAGYTVIPIAAGFYIGGAFAHNEKARETGVLGAEAIVDAVIVGEVLKLATQRQRPLDGNGNGRFFAGGSSFPSGHSAVSWALASVVAHEYNKNVFYPIAAYGLASLVSLSRLSGQQHFASDVVAGSAMGWFIGRYVFKTHVDHSIHHRPESKLSQLRPQSVMPQFDSDMRGVVLSWGH